MLSPKMPALWMLRRIVVRPNPISPSGAGLAFVSRSLVTVSFEAIELAIYPLPPCPCRRIVRILIGHGQRRNHNEGPDRRRIYPRLGLLVYPSPVSCRMFARS